MEIFFQLFSLFLVIAIGPLVVIALALTNSKSL